MKVESYLMFEGRCEEALDFYRSALGAKVGTLMRYKDNPEPAAGQGCADGSGPGPTPEMVMHAEFTVGETTLMASDGMGSGKASFQGISLALMPCERSGGPAPVQCAGRRWPGADAAGQDLLLAGLRHGGRPLWRAVDGGGARMSEAHQSPNTGTAMLALYGHPFSSYTQKVLTALYENGTPFELRNLDPAAPGNHAPEWLRRWPLAKFPLLVDGDHTVVESSIVIEHLQMAHPGPVQLIPADPAAALQVRFMDRFFDLHVMAPVQHAVNAALTGDPAKRVDGVAWAADKLEKAYAWLEGEWARRTWAAGDGFTMADCAAAPALFYADWTHPIAASYPLLRAYRARLLARPSFAQAVEGGRPYRHYFPLGAPDRD